MPVDRFGGGSLMVWGRVHYAGKTNLIVIRQYCPPVSTHVLFCPCVTLSFVVDS
jgi:hypothetical protein